MDAQLQFNITTFFDYWRKRYEFINSLDRRQHSHEAYVLLLASLDALSNIWKAHIGKNECGKGKRIIFDTFLARYGGQIFQRVALPDVWHRADQGNVWADCKKNRKFPEEVKLFLTGVGNRQLPPQMDRSKRQSSQDFTLEEIMSTFLKSHPATQCSELNEVRDWLCLSRYGAIAYKELRCEWLHEGQPGSNTHNFHLAASETAPTYLSGIYGTPPVLGFSIALLLRTLKDCIDSFEREALILEQDPSPY